MISNGDNSGLFSFIIGVIVIVLSAVGLSVLVDKRFHFSSSASSLSREIEAGEAELEHCKLLHQTSMAELGRVEPAATRNAEELASLRLARGKLDRKHNQLSVTAAELQESIRNLEKEFSNYKENYRNKVRRDAVGRKLGDMTLKNGREYKGAYIVKVTDVGLEIRHDTGTARIQPTDLEASMQDVFQWNQEESAKRLGEEAALRNSIGFASGQPLKSSPPRIERDSIIKPETAPVAQNRSKIREKVRAWSLKVSQLEIEHSQALVNANSTGRIAGPGGLETWQERSDRLASEVARARGHLAAARSELSLEAPNDPLLRAAPVRH